MADLKATNSRLEVDVMKVRHETYSSRATTPLTADTQANKTKTQELHAAKEASDAQIAEQAIVVKRVQEEAKALENKRKTAEDRVKELEQRLEESEARIIDAETRLEESSKAVKKVSHGTNRGIEGYANTENVTAGRV